MRQGSFGWLVGPVLVVLPAAAAWGQGGPDAPGQAGIGGPAGTCAILFGGRKFDVGDGAWAVAMGDLDGDGDLDLAVLRTMFAACGCTWRSDLALHPVVRFLAEHADAGASAAVCKRVPEGLARVRELWSSKACTLAGLSPGEGQLENVG